MEGTCIAIAGANYCVIAADSNICKLSDKYVMASSGFQAEVVELQKNLSEKRLDYQQQHNKQMSCSAMAECLSSTLYAKNFTPRGSFNVLGALLGGLDNEGKGCVFTYDGVGSRQRVGYDAWGMGSRRMMPVLDNQLKSPSPLLLPAQDATTTLLESQAVDLVKKVFASATEIVVVNAEGVKPGLGVAL